MESLIWKFGKDFWGLFFCWDYGLIMWYWELWVVIFIVI